MSIRAGTEDLASVDAWKATAAEFIALFLFVFIGPGAVVAALSVSNGQLNAAAIVGIAAAHGLAIGILVSATASISGGHINPAVTLSAVITGRISLTRGVMYWAGQLLGALLGALVLAAVVPDNIQGELGAHSLGPGVTAGAGLVIEVVLTFALVFVVFATAMDPKGPGQIAPLAIGFTILVIHLMAVPFTGASVNPARSFGPAVVARVWANHWIYWVGPLVGGGLAGLVYQYVFMGRETPGQPPHTEGQPRAGAPSRRGRR